MLKCVTLMCCHLQTHVSGVCGGSGVYVRSHVVEDSASVSEQPWQQPSDHNVHDGRANHRTATPASVQVCAHAHIMYKDMHPVYSMITGERMCRFI